MKLTIIAVLIIIGIIIFLRSERKRGRNVYDIAESLEKEGDYEAACYHYAIALNAGLNQNNCHDKVSKLWEEHGPFEFKKQLKEAKEEVCRYESCGEGAYTLTVSDIHKIIETNKN